MCIKRRAVFQDIPSAKAKNNATNILFWKSSFQKLSVRLKPLKDIVLPAHVEILSDVKPDDFPFDWYAIAHEKHFWFKSRMDAFFSFAKNICPANQNLSVLEIGCGNGLVRRQIEQKTSWITEGADINLKALELNTGLKGKTYLYNIHERKAEMAGKYDVVILFDVLEHIPDTTEFLESCLYHLKAGGILFINVPALDQYKSRYDEVVGHIRRYDKRMMEKEFETLPAKVLDTRYWAMGLVPLLLMRKWAVKDKKDIKAVVEKGLNPPNEIMNRLMYAFLKAENAIFPRPFTGASLLAAIQKEK